MDNSSDEELIDDLYTNNSSENELDVLKRESSMNQEQTEEIIQDYYRIKVDGYDKAMYGMQKYPFIKLFAGMIDDTSSANILYYLSTVEFTDEFMEKIALICRKKILDAEKILAILKNESSR